MSRLKTTKEERDYWKSLASAAPTQRLAPLAEVMDRLLSDADLAEENEKKLGDMAIEMLRRNADIDDLKSRLAAAETEKPEMRLHSLPEQCGPKMNNPPCKNGRVYDPAGQDCGPCGCSCHVAPVEKPDFWRCETCLGTWKKKPKEHYFQEESSFCDGTPRPARWIEEKP